MVHVSIRYYNLVADFLGRREEQRALPPGSSLLFLVQALAAESGPFQRLALTADGQVSGHVRLFRNGEMVHDLSTMITDGDEVRVFPAISGGG
jgi:molybdopterin converting factor small subunit